MKSNNGVNDAGLSAEDRQLVNEIQKHIDKTNSTQLICNYEIGKLINGAYGEQKIYGSGQVERIAEQVGKAPSTLYGYLGLAQDYTEENIQTLADGKFSTPYKLLKAYKKFGSNEIMRIYDEVDSLNEFKAKLKARWLELKVQKNNEHLEPTVEPQAGEGDGDDEKGPDDTATPDTENSPRGENLPLSEEDPSSAPTTPPGEKSPQDQNENDNPDSEDNPSAPVVPTTPDAEATPALDDAPELAPEGEDPQENPPTETQDHSTIKHATGSATNNDPPANDDGGTLASMMDKNFPENPSESTDGLTTIARSKLNALLELEKKYIDLKVRVDELEQEKMVWEQEKEYLEEKLYELEYQLSEAKTAEELAF